MADLLENNNIPVYLKGVDEGFTGHTYKEFKTWGDIRVELFNGMVYMMASSDEWHCWVQSNIIKQLSVQLEGKKCSVYAEFDVRLFYEEDESDKTVFRPDIIVVCDEKKVLGKKNCEGTPDFIIEVMSEFSEGRDLVDKKKFYERAGVKEYWVITKHRVHVFILKEGLYYEGIEELNRNLKYSLTTLKGCYIDFAPFVDRYNVY